MTVSQKAIIFQGNDENIQSEYTVNSIAWLL